MGYRSEFGDYDGELPDLDQFEDSSWHNDTCPKLTRELFSDGGRQTQIVVWCDYVDPEKREGGGRHRFDVRFNEKSVLETDDVAELHAFIKGVLAYWEAIW